MIKSKYKQKEMIRKIINETKVRNINLLCFVW